MSRVDVAGGRSLLASELPPTHPIHPHRVCRVRSRSGAVIGDGTLCTVATRMGDESIQLALASTLSNLRPFIPESSEVVQSRHQHSRALLPGGGIVTLPVQVFALSVTLQDEDSKAGSDSQWSTPTSRFLLKFFNGYCRAVFWLGIR